MPHGQERLRWFVTIAAAICVLGSAAGCGDSEDESAGTSTEGYSLESCRTLAGCCSAAACQSAASADDDAERCHELIKQYCPDVD